MKVSHCERLLIALQRHNSVLLQILVSINFIFVVLYAVNFSFFDQSAKEIWEW